MPLQSVFLLLNKASEWKVLQVLITKLQSVRCTITKGNIIFLLQKPILFVNSALSVRNFYIPMLTASFNFYSLMPFCKLSRNYPFTSQAFILSGSLPLPYLYACVCDMAGRRRVSFNGCNILVGAVCNQPFIFASFVVRRNAVGF